MRLPAPHVIFFGIAYAFVAVVILFSRPSPLGLVFGVFRDQQIAPAQNQVQVAVGQRLREDLGDGARR